MRRPFVTLPAVVTHNFDPARGALRNVCDLADAAVEAVLDGIRATGTARLSPGYLARRRRTEAWLLAACTRKLGVPPLPRPLYFFLGDFDDGLDPSRPASLVLPLALFPADALTFTWPDSMVSVEANGHPWRGQVFTLAEVEAQVATHGLPGRGDEDPFIEVQVWDDAPLRGLALP